jgi:hypothetical protein
MDPRTRDLLRCIQTLLGALMDAYPDPTHMPDPLHEGARQCAHTYARALLDWWGERRDGGTERRDG